MPTILDARTAISHFPGIGRYACQLARSLARQSNRDELIILTNANSTEARFDFSMPAAQPGIRIVPVDAPPFSVKEQTRLPGILRKLTPRLTHFPYLVMPYAAPRPLVLTVHDIIPLQLPRFFTSRQRILYRLSLELALRRADAVICVSESTRSDLLSRLHLSPSRLFVVPEGVGEAFRDSAEKEVQRARAAWDLPSEYLLYVGSNKPHKNLPALVEAFAQLKTSAVLVLAGPEDNRFDQERRISERLGLGNRVRCLGTVPEALLPGLYSGALAFVFPSLYEGFGLPVLEAMACGIPVACSNIPSLRETCARAALFFNPGDCRSIALALEQIIQDKRLRTDLRDSGFKRAAELSWDAAAKKTLEVYGAVGSG